MVAPFNILLEDTFNILIIDKPFNILIEDTFNEELIDVIPFNKL